MAEQPNLSDRVQRLVEETRQEARELVLLGQGEIASDKSQEAQQLLTGLSLLGQGLGTLLRYGIQITPEELQAYYNPQQIEKDELMVPEMEQEEGVEDISLIPVIRHIPKFEDEVPPPVPQEPVKFHTLVPARTVQIPLPPSERPVTQQRSENQPVPPAPDGIRKIIEGPNYADVNARRLQAVSNFVINPTISGKTMLEILGDNYDGKPYTALQGAWALRRVMSDIELRQTDEALLPEEEVVAEQIRKRLLKSGLTAKDFRQELVKVFPVGPEHRNRLYVEVGESAKWRIELGRLAEKQSTHVERAVEIVRNKVLKRQPTLSSEDLVSLVIKKLPLDLVSGPYSRTYLRDTRTAIDTFMKIFTGDSIEFSYSEMIKVADDKLRNQQIRQGARTISQQIALTLDILDTPQFQDYLLPKYG